MQINQTKGVKPKMEGYKLRRADPVTVRSKAWVFGRSLTGIVGSNPTGGMDVCLL
jgi:hypothetical protein